MNRESNYVLSARAKQDIRQIADYTLDNFGVNQSLAYAQALIKVIQKLASNPELGRAYVPIKAHMVFRYRFKAHVLFYYKVPEGIFVLRVLGGKMDFERHLG
ncbi:type II toxin-antitoxin system RelE/ParE family toxin [Sediminicola luteus]|uniref:Toxin n=1 Tax=Sediminicola luteus TaxID=319238 RepID=A0A2A4GC83_9FLAO|nr:type II toxin-antitoxin system RelE/ParE family toxin [Sediminicola luteus]PCE66217.1 hypothetical protein B7P33_02650 [Sediminicola luteus]